jgi:hypothetical protein
VPFGGSAATRTRHITCFLKQSNPPDAIEFPQGNRRCVKNDIRRQKRRDVQVKTERCSQPQGRVGSGTCLGFKARRRVLCRRLGWAAGQTFAAAAAMLPVACRANPRPQVSAATLDLGGMQLWRAAILLGRWLCLGATTACRAFRRTTASDTTTFGPGAAWQDGHDQRR